MADPTGATGMRSAVSTCRRPHRFGVAQRVDVEVPCQPSRLKLRRLDLRLVAARLERAESLQLELRVTADRSAAVCRQPSTGVPGSAGLEVRACIDSGTGRDMHGVRCEGRGRSGQGTRGVLTVNSPLTPGSSASGAASIMGFMPTALFASRSRIWGVSASHTAVGSCALLCIGCAERIQAPQCTSVNLGAGRGGQQITRSNITTVSTHHPPSDSDR